MRNGSVLAPFSRVVAEPVVDSPGFMSKLFANLNVLFAPGEEAAIQVENLSAGPGDFLLTLVGFSWSNINEMEGWIWNDVQNV